MNAEKMEIKMYTFHSEKVGVCSLFLVCIRKWIEAKEDKIFFQVMQASIRYFRVNIISSFVFKCLCVWDASHSWISLLQFHHLPFKTINLGSCTSEPAILSSREFSLQIICFNQSELRSSEYNKLSIVCFNSLVGFFPFPLIYCVHARIKLIVVCPLTLSLPDTHITCIHGTLYVLHQHSLSNTYFCPSQLRYKTVT